MSPRRQYGTGSICQRSSDGLWIARIEAGTSANGTRRRITVSAKTKADCLAKLKAKQREIQATGLPAAGTARTTVKAWSEQWLPIHATKVRPTTYTTDAGTIRKWIVPTIGHRRLTELTPADLRALRDAITSAGRSSTTAAHCHRVFVKMMRDAIVEGHQVPVRILQVPKPRNAPNDRTAIPVDQALSILRVALQGPDAPRWVAAILQGMRQGETLGLTWDAVDLERGVIDVSWQLQWLTEGHTKPDGWEARHVVGNAWWTRPKTSSGQRLIPMVSWMRAALIAAREDWRPNPWGLIWTDEDGMPIRDEDDRERWRLIQQKANARHPSGRAWHGHEMRHTSMSLLAGMGVDRSVIESIVGQAVLVESYLHVDLEKARAALEVGAGILGIEGPKP